MRLRVPRGLRSVGPFRFPPSFFSSSLVVDQEVKEEVTKLARGTDESFCRYTSSGRALCSTERVSVLRK